MDFRPSDFGPDCIAVGRASSPFGGMSTVVYRREHDVEGLGRTEEAARARYAEVRADMERAGVEVVPPEPEPTLAPDMLGHSQVGWTFGIGRVRIRLKRALTPA